MMRFRAGLFLGCFGAMLSCSVSLLAQLPLPLGNQVLANVTTFLNQDESALARGPNGDFLVVWRDESIDGNLSAILARRFSGRTGQPLSGEIPVNVTTAGDQRNPDVAVAADGRFVVVWEGPDPTSPGVFGAVLDPNGEPVPAAAEFLVNVTTSGVQRRPAVSFRPGGGFLIVWEDRSTNPSRIVARIFPADFPSNPPSGEIQVNLLPAAGDQEQPTTIPDPIGGGWLVAWQGLVEPPVPLEGGIDPVAAVLLRRLTGAGSGNAELLLNTTHDLSPRGHVTLATNGAGGAIAAWEALDSVARGIYGRRIQGGIPVGTSEFAINLLQDLDEGEPTVTIDQDGNFVAAWVRNVGALDSGSGDPATPEGSPIVIKGRKSSGGGFAELGGPPAPDEEFQINSSGSSFARPRIANEPRGSFVVAWSGEDTTDPDGSGVYFRRFADAIFADGFETENTSRWSTTVP